MSEYREIIEQILDLEWSMFINVRSDREAPCQSAPDAFRKIRGSLFEVWTQEMLGSYLRDLLLARERGENLLTAKYARMDNLIEPLKSNPVIERIVYIEKRWQDEIMGKYPALYERCCRKTDTTGDGRDFSVYLMCELETYGDHTLELYFENVRNADEKNINLAMDALQALIRKSGYRDLDHAEANLDMKIA